MVGLLFMLCNILSQTIWPLKDLENSYFYRRLLYQEWLHVKVRFLSSKLSYLHKSRCLRCPLTSWLYGIQSKHAKCLTLYPTLIHRRIPVFWFLYVGRKNTSTIWLDFLELSLKEFRGNHSFHSKVAKYTSQILPLSVRQARQVDHLSLRKGSQATDVVLGW